MENLENTPPAHDITLGGQKEKGLNDSRVYSSAVAQLALGGDPPPSCSSFPELRSRDLLMVSGAVCLQTQGFLEGWLGVEMCLAHSSCALRVMLPRKKGSGASLGSNAPALGPEP